jgi:Zn-dependent protease with chaperone function
MARLLFRVSRFLLMAAPAGVMGPRLGGLLFIGVAAFAVTALQQEIKDEAQLESRLKQMPSWLEARRAQGGPQLAAWQKWLLVWGSWGWKGEPLLARAWFSKGKLIPSERSYMLVDDENEPSASDRLAVIALLLGLLAMPLSVIVVGWFLGGSLGVQAGSVYRGAFDVTLILLIASYFVLTLLHEQIFLFTSIAASDPELEAMCRPAALRISYMPQPAHRWMRAGLLDRPWRKVVFINAIDYERLTRDELKALVAHEMVHLQQHHDLLFGVQLRLLLVGAALLYWTLDLFRLLPALPNPGAAQSLVILLGVIFLGLFVLPYGQGRVAERRAYLGAAATVGAAPVLRVLRADSVRHPSWVRQVMSELERQADAEARARAEDRPR